MKRSGRSARKAFNLSESISRQLNMYSLTAGAAAGIASIQPSQAEIVYTPAHHVIKVGHSYNLDLNHDGTTEFAILDFENPVGTSTFLAQLAVKQATGNSVVGTKNEHSIDLAAALNRGVQIGAGQNFYRVPLGMASNSVGPAGSSARGKWVNVSNRYLGLAFQIHGKTHYGWARLSVAVAGLDITATLTGYAYETIPDKPIVAGKTKGAQINSVGRSNSAVPVPRPATLGLLAAGSPALSVWRRKYVVGAMQ